MPTAAEHHRTAQQFLRMAATATSVENGAIYATTAVAHAALAVSAQLMEIAVVVAGLTAPKAPS